MQLKTTIHPFKAASRVSASSGLKSRSWTKSSLSRIILCIRAIQAVMTAVSEHIVDMDSGASLYFVRISYNDFPVVRPVAVSFTFRKISYPETCDSEYHESPLDKLTTMEEIVNGSMMTSSTKTIKRVA